MALTNWKGKIVRKQDIYIAKNDGMYEKFNAERKKQDALLADE